MTFEPPPLSVFLRFRVFPESVLIPVHPWLNAFRSWFPRFLASLLSKNSAASRHREAIKIAWYALLVPITDGSTLAQAFPVSNRRWYGARCQPPSISSRPPFPRFLSSPHGYAGKLAHKRIEIRSIHPRPHDIENSPALWRWVNPSNKPVKSRQGLQNHAFLQFLPHFCWSKMFSSFVGFREGASRDSGLKELSIQIHRLPSPARDTMPFQPLPIATQSS